MTSNNQILYKKAKLLIPGGTQLLSKRPEMFLPDQWPTYYVRAEGVEVEDLDGKVYVDMSYSGIGACVLGYADPDVNAAVTDAINRGSMSTLNCPEEVELAELLCKLHPWANMARFARCGGEAMMIAVRIARAKTGRDKIAFCGYHGWNDWYLACNLKSDKLGDHLLPGLNPAGVPKGLVGTAIPFPYNKLGALEEIVKNHAGEIAAIVMEPERGSSPEPGFLEGVRDIARRSGAVLVFDEVTSGWRVNGGGIHMTYGVEPDIAVFAKGMSNGYPMSAIIGNSETMSAAEDTFISSTYWTERIGPVAALATIRKHLDKNVSRHLIEIGEKVQDGWARASKKAGVNIKISGIPPLSHFVFCHEDNQVMNTLFCQEMLERGFLAKNGFYASYAHQDIHVANYTESVEVAFYVIAKAIKNKSAKRLLKGPVAHAGFKRLTD